MLRDFYSLTVFYWNSSTFQYMYLYIYSSKLLSTYFQLSFYLINRRKPYLCQPLLLILSLPIFTIQLLEFQTQFKASVTTLDVVRLLETGRRGRGSEFYFVSALPTSGSCSVSREVRKFRASERNSCL